MKKLVILLAVILTANVMMAQKKDRTDAYMYNKNGQFERAVTSIEKCVNHESFLGMKPKDQAQAWHYRSMIYQNVIQNPDLAAKYPNAMDLAYESLQKCIAADKSYYADNADDINNRISSIAGSYFQTGINHFNNNAFADAAVNFRKSYEISLNGVTPDTSALVNTAMAYQLSKKYEEALNNYTELKNLGYQGKDLFKNMAACYTAMGNDDQSLATITEGLDKYPGDAGLIIEKVNLYLKQGKGEDAINDLNQLHDLEPDNASILFILGTIYGDDTHEIFDADKAIGYYNEALAIDPDFYDADFNLAALYVNLANKKNAEANDLLATGFTKAIVDQANALTKEGDAFLELGLPHAERVFNAQPSADLGQVLKTIYVRLKMMNEAQELDKKLKEL